MAYSTTQAIDVARSTKRKSASDSGNSQKDASLIQYEDDYEKVNDGLRLTWSTFMDEGHYKTSFRSVKCLLISWSPECDDLHTGIEVYATDICTEA